MKRVIPMRCGSLVLTAVAALMFSGCDVDRLLEANNPDAIHEDQLDDETLIEVLVASVIGQLANEYHNPIIWDGSKLTDEHVSGINWPTTQDLGVRKLPYDAGPANTMFRALSRVRFMGDSISSRLDKLLDAPQADRRKAVVEAYAGYGYVLMAETMCEATIDVGERIYTPMELGQMGVDRFRSAITVATAAGPQARDALNLANAGLARAAMIIGDDATAMEAASRVSSDFVWWVEYQNQVMSNYLQGASSGANHNMGVHPRVLSAWGTYGEVIPPEAQTDPRVQFNPLPRTGHDARTILYTPLQSLPYSEYTGTTQLDDENPPIGYTNDTNIRLASYLDAMHNYYEAAGPGGTGPEGTTLDFVNQRRAVGNQPPVDLSGEALMSELREQRLRDLFMGGFRLGDLRRWEARGINDPNHQFPTGTHPNAVLGQYGDVTCFPLPIAEYVGNPNIRR